MSDYLWTLTNNEEQKFARRNTRPSVTELVEELVVGEYPNPDDIPWLKHEHRITAIHSLQDDRDLKVNGLDIREIERTCREHGIQFVRTPIADGSSDDLAARLPEALEILHQLIASGARVYLHCNAGINRSPTIAIAFLHAYRNLSLEEATRFVKERRNCGPFLSVLEEHFKTNR